MHTARPRRRTAAWLVLAIFASLLALVGATAAPSPASAAATPTITGEPCAPGVGVTVVVDFQQIGGQGIEVGCAPGQQADGFAALTNAGFTFNESGGPVAGTICQIRSQPTAGYPSCWYSGFWGYWKSNGSEAWKWSDVGASDGPLAIDRVEGWSWTSPIPSDYSGTPMRITVDQIDELLEDPVDCSVIPQLPTFDIVSSAETLPVTIVDGKPVEVAVLTDPAADPSTATWTTATSVPLSSYSGKIRILAKGAGTACPGAMFDATYDVRAAYTPRWNAAAGTAGGPSNAIDKGDDRFKGWITGHSEYTPGGNVATSWQVPANAYGPVDSSLVVLGDRGSYTATFGAPITDGAGYDFAAFENGFASGANDFLEVAYLEVSSDGTHFVRFDSASRRTTTVAAFGTQNPAELGGLAGKDLANKGTPFDLSVLKNKPEVRSGQVDLNRITHVRLKDIQGDGNDKDSFGRPIYDPNPVTGSAGYDLTGIGVINQLDEVAPVVTLTSAPGGTVSATSASVAYTVNDATATVERQLDGGAWTPATSPVALTGLAPGLHTLKVRATDPAGNVGTATATWTVSSITLVSDAPTAVTGQPVTVTATTTAGVKGSMLFFDGATQIGKVTVKDGAASLKTAKLAVGSHAITAQYLPTATATPEGSPTFTQVVDKGATTATVTAAPTSTVFGEKTKLTAVVVANAPAVGSPKGTISFYDDGTLLGTANVSSGKASLTVGASVGSHPITAVYGGNESFASSASTPLDHQVGEATTTVAVTSSVPGAVAGQSVSLKVKVTTDAPSKAKPVGTVDLYEGAILVASKESTSGSVTFPLKPSVGTHEYSVVYRGTTGVGGSSATIEQVVAPASTTTALTTTTPTLASNKALKLTALVKVVAPGAETITGQVELRDGTTVVGTYPLVTGKASITLSGLTPGSHSYTATFTGDGSWAGSETTAPLVVTIT